MLYITTFWHIVLNRCFFTIIYYHILYLMSSILCNFIPAKHKHHACDIIHTNQRSNEMLLYQAIKENLYHEDIGNYVSYGIAVTQDGVTVDFISDVSVDEDEVRELARIFTESGLSPIHLVDAVEDFLSDGVLPAAN